MTICVGVYEFDGPHLTTEALQERSGAYAVLGRNQGTEPWTVVDIGEAGGVRSRVSQHDRKTSWQSQNQRELACAAFYCNEAQRMRIEQELRARYRPDCGQEPNEKQLHARVELQKASPP